MDHLFCMRMFARVVELGSFARASEDLEVSRPTATTAVAQLEKRLGVRLLHRTTRQLSPTEDGRAYYENCVRILGEITEAEDLLSTARRSPRGRLRVSIPQAFIHLRFFPALPKFLARYPEIVLELVLTDRALNLVEEGIDCAVRGSAIPDDSTLVARHVSNVRLVTCAAPAYLKARGVPKKVADLERHNCVRFVSPSTGRTVDWSFRKGDAQATFTPRGNLGVTSFDAAGAAALGGIGIAQVPEALVLAGLRAGKLRAVLFDWIAPAPTLNVVYPSRRYLTAKVRAFAEFVAEVFPADEWERELREICEGALTPTLSLKGEGESGRGRKRERET